MNKVAKKIAEEIKARGAISFARFMELALYCPVYGYYEREKDSLGPRGDFYTSVGVGSLFGELLAFHFAAILDGAIQIPPPPSAPCPLPSIVEAGAHDGRLACDILAWMRDHRPDLFERLEYCIAEPSSRRRKWQQENLGEFLKQVRWVKEVRELADNHKTQSGKAATGSREAFGVRGIPPLSKASHHTKAGAYPALQTLRDFQRRTKLHRGLRTISPIAAHSNPASRGVHGIIFSNELLDAMPVHRVGWDAKKRLWFEWGVTLKNGEFLWSRMPDSARSSITPSIPDALLAVLPDGFTTEVCPEAERWWAEAASVLESGKLLTLDYGLETEELFAPERNQGTLRCYQRHHFGRDLLADLGEQDITAHVNFTAIRKAGESAGLKTDCFSNQAQFLTTIAAEAWKKDASFSKRTPEKTRQFQTLTHPDHLGRSFRVLVQSRD